MILLYSDGRFFRTVTLANQPKGRVKIQVVQAQANPAKAKEFFPPVKLERTRDTGLRAPEEVGSGLFASNPFTMTVDEADLLPGVQYQIQHCHHWSLTNALCEEWSEPMTRTLCLTLVQDDAPQRPDEDCCYDGPIVGGWFEVYAPLILKGYR